jgi:hypothetical protein
MRRHSQVVDELRALRAEVAALRGALGAQGEGAAPDLTKGRS